MYSLIHKVYFYAASGGESDPKRLTTTRHQFQALRPTVSIIADFTFPSSTVEADLDDRVEQLAGAGHGEGPQYAKKLCSLQVA
jgi:hypothetical protein